MTMMKCAADSSKETHSVKEGFLPQTCLKLCEMDEPVLTVTDNPASNTKTSASGGELRPMAHHSLLLALAQNVPAFAARANNLCSDSCGIVSHHRIPLRRRDPGFPGCPIIGLTRLPIRR